ncbi:18155_t:CDS:1, partial [Funneliformis geosporum]
LKTVPTMISHQHIKRALFYYGPIETLEDKFRNRHNSSQDVIIIFKRLTKPHQLNLA